MDPIYTNLLSPEIPWLNQRVGNTLDIEVLLGKTDLEFRRCGQYLLIHAHTPTMQIENSP